MISQLLGHLKRESLVAAITCVVVGVLFIVWPGKSLTFLLRILALILLVEGVICLVRMIKSTDSLQRNSFALPMAACIFVGLLLLVAPRFVAGIFPVIIGLFMLFHGIKGIATARHGSRSTMVGTLGSVIMMIVGILLIARPFGALKVLMVVVGIGLVYDGLVMHRLTGGIAEQARQFREGHNKDIIDVDYKEEDVN